MYELHLFLTKMQKSEELKPRLVTVLLKNISTVSWMTGDIIAACFKELLPCFRRFTCRLAERCKSVTAVDFIEKFVHKNRELNGHLGNCRFLQADVAKLQQPINRWNY